MATATAQVVTNKSYDVNLSDDEAQFLKWLLGNRIIGKGKWRTVSDGIWDALHRANIENVRVPMKAKGGGVTTSVFGGNGFVELAEAE